MNKPESTTKRIVLAEDDEDDFLLFQEALNEYEEPIRLNWVKDGEELMKLLKQDSAEIPDIVFLDINMPRKNGFECLTEIRSDVRLKKIPVIIYSTSDDPKLIDGMYTAGANLYLCKPVEFKKLKNRIHKAISIDWEKQTPFSKPEHFVLG